MTEDSIACRQVPAQADESRESDEVTRRRKPGKDSPIESMSASCRTQILALLAVAQLMGVLDFSIVNVALPSIQRTYHLTPADLQWVVSAYALVFGGFLRIYSMCFYCSSYLHLCYNEPGVSSGSLRL